MTSQTIPGGFMSPEVPMGEYNKMAFIINGLIGKMQTVTLVKVVSCTNSGGLSPVGFVDVVPMVNQIDAAGNPQPHSTIHNLPYMRVQGGTDAIIIDPKVGDIGLAAFASRDISKVKKTKAQANPGSFRKYDYADGLYIGGFLNGTPTQYIQFSSSGITINSPAQVRITAPSAIVDAATTTINATAASINASGTANVTSPSISLGASGQTLHGLVTDAMTALFNGHTHTSAASGSPTSTPLQTMGSGQLTTTIKGG